MFCSMTSTTSKITFPFAPWARFVAIILVVTVTIWTYVLIILLYLPAPVTSRTPYVMFPVTIPNLTLSMTVSTVHNPRFFNFSLVTYWTYFLPASSTGTTCNFSVLITFSTRDISRPLAFFARFGLFTFTSRARDSTLTMTHFAFAHRKLLSLSFFVSSFCDH